jgi:hypothetical protein
MVLAGPAMATYPGRNGAVAHLAAAESGLDEPQSDLRLAAGMSSIFLTRDKARDGPASWSADGRTLAWTRSTG